MKLFVCFLFLISKTSFEQRTVLKNHTNFVIATCYIPSNDRFPDGLIVTGGNDKKICVYSAKQGTHLFTLEGHEQTGKIKFIVVTKNRWIPIFSFKVSCLYYVPQSDLLLSGSWDCTARVWSLSTQKCIQTLRGINEEDFVFL